MIIYTNIILRYVSSAPLPRRFNMTRKYSKSSQAEVKKEMHEFKKGTARSGPKRKPVKSRKQAIAIGLSIARKEGAKVPKKSKA